MTKETIYIPVTCEDNVSLEVKDIDTGEIKMWVEEQEGYFFTPKQLNEYTQRVIKQALETAADKVEHEEYKFDGKQPPISKQSITTAFEEIFQKYKV